MDLALSDERRELQATSGRLLAERCPPSLVRALKDEADREGYAALWRSLCASGLLGLGLPEAFGGGGGNLIDVGLVVEQAGRYLAPAAFKGTVLAGLVLRRLGDEQLQKRLLPSLCAGDLAATVLFGRVSGTSDTVGASRSDDGLVLSGTIDLAVVPGSSQLAIVATGGEGRTTIVLVHLPHPAVRREPRRALGTVDVCRLVFADCRVPSEDIVAEGSDDDPGLRWVLDLISSIEAVEAVGGATAALDRTVEYISNRYQFGRPIGSFQAPQHHVANVSVAINGARLAAFEALWMLDSGVDVGPAAYIARAVSARTFKHATLRAHQLHGGIGMTLDSDLHLWSERAKLLELLGESWDDLLDRVGAQLGTSSLNRKDAATT